MEIKIDIDKSLLRAKISEAVEKVLISEAKYLASDRYGNDIKDIVESKVDKELNKFKPEVIEEYLKKAFIIYLEKYNIKDIIKTMKNKN
tara:strand:+ start:6070 stop:6336 length:267 start_codon:yes stop_codon:yes gene_type:complete